MSVQITKNLLGWDELTRQQRAVARLAGEGMTNPEIADHLGITAVTVKSHLRQVFAKLGVRGRTALAIQLSRREAGLANGLDGTLRQ